METEELRKLVQAEISKVLQPEALKVLEKQLLENNLAELVSGLREDIRKLQIVVEDHSDRFADAERMAAQRAAETPG